MASESREHTPSRISKTYQHQTVTSYGRQTDRKAIQQLKQRTNDLPSSNYQYSRQNREIREIRQARQARQTRQARENRENRENRQARQIRQTRQIRQLRQNKPIESVSRYADRQNMTLMRQYEALKLKVRQLQTQNKHLQAELDKVDYQKNYVEKQFKQKIAFQQQSLLQFQKQRNYQLELLQIKNQEDISKLRRQYDYQIDQLQKELKNQQYSNRQKVEEINYLEVRNAELKKELESVERELVKSRQNNSNLNQQLTKQEFASKKFQSLFDDVQRQRNQMQMQIHVLLDIQAQKSRTINTLQMQLCSVESSQRSLQQKVTHLTQNFCQLQSHITLMKQRLLQSDQLTINMERELTIKQQQNNQLQRDYRNTQERERELRQQLDITQGKMTKREVEVQQLMQENQRIYRELNKAKHMLHQVSINHNIDI